jgi:hypothetical protein
MFEDKVTGQRLEGLDDNNVPICHKSSICFVDRWDVTFVVTCELDQPSRAVGRELEQVMQN